MGLIRTILNNYRDIAIYERAMREIVLALEGFPICTIKFGIDNYDEALRLATTLSRKVVELEKELEELRKGNITDTKKSNSNYKGPSTPVADYINFATLIANKEEEERANHINHISKLVREFGKEAVADKISWMMSDILRAYPKSKNIDTAVELLGTIRLEIINGVYSK